MDDQLFAWLAFGVYAALTTGLALVGMRRTTSMSSFAIGNQDMSAGLVGVALAASMASTATFVINPGFVYTYGLSALIAFTIPLFIGMFAGLLVLARPFRELGDRYQAITMPDWIDKRFKSPRLATFFSLLSLLNVFYMVLIVVGSAYLMQMTLGLEYQTSLFVVVGFVFAYTMLGGAYAHAYTNGIQGVMMAIVAVVIFASGLTLFDGGITEMVATLKAQDPLLLTATNPTSPYFSTYFEVIFCALVLGFGLVTQPHILTKSLYLKTPKDMRRFVLVGGGAFVLFSLVYFAGFYARAAFPGIENQDTVMAVYLAKVFTPKVSALISVAVLAAAMSTLDGLLVAVSSIVAHDLVRQLVPNDVAEAAGKDKMAKWGLWASRIVVVVLGVVVLLIALDPPKLVGIFGAIGLYGIIAASMVPLIAAVLLDDLPVGVAAASAVLGPATHFALYLGGASVNPAITATVGVGASLLPFLPWAIARACVRTPALNLD